MKCNCFTLVTLIFPLAAFCQTDSHVPQFSLEDNKIIYYEQLRTAEPADKATLFLRAENWYKNNFETSDNTLTIDNSTDGVVSGTGIIHASRKDQKADAGDIFFTIDIRVANDSFSYKVYSVYSFDNMGKYYFSDMYNEEQYPPAKPKWQEAYRHSMLVAMNDKITGMISVLKQRMQ